MLCCEITYSRGDNLDTTSDKELIDRVKNDLVTCSFISEGSFLEGDVVRIPEVYPMFKVGYRQMMNRDISLISQFKNMPVEDDSIILNERAVDSFIEIR